jgi:transcriptional regulator with XRE-family HTH domain
MPSRRLRLAQRRRAAGFSQEGLANLLGVDRSTVVRWEAADTEPQPWLRPKLAEALGVTGEELRALLDDVGESDRPDDRMAYVLEHPASTDLVAVARLHERIRQLDESYDQTPSIDLIGAAGQVHGQVAYLREHAKSARVRRALYGVEAESSTLVGQLVWDVSQRHDHGAATAYFDQAIEAARLVGDSSLESYAVLRKSFVALYGESDPVKGRAFASEAAEIASPRSPSLAGLALLHVAEGHAMTGDVRRCEQALTKAERQFDHVDDNDVAADYYTMNEFNRLAGSCYLFLELPDRAEPILEATARALSMKKKSQAIVMANLALALIRQTKLDHAASVMHQTIDIVEATRGGGALNLAFAAGRELKPWRGEVWVQDINDRLLALMASA